MEEEESLDLTSPGKFPWVIAMIIAEARTIRGKIG